MPSRAHTIGFFVLAALLLVVFVVLRAETPSSTEMVRSAAAEVPVAAPAPVPVPTSVRVPILIYHNIRPAPPRALSAADKQFEVTPAQLDAHLVHLKAEGYVGIGFADLLAAQRGEKTLPEKAVIITFDDGRASQYENAVPLLRAHGFVATFFIFSNAVGRPGYFTWEQLKELRAEGMTIGSHTRFHPYLTRIKSDDELRTEIASSKKTLEEGLGAPVEFLAYPFGLFDDRVIAETKAAGYLAARSLKHTTTHAPGDEFGLGGYITVGSLEYLKGILASP